MTISNLRFLCGAGLLVIGLGACSDNRLQELEVAVRSMRTDISDLRGIQAQHMTSINDMKTDLRQVTGKMDEVQHETTGRTAQLESTLRQVSARVPPPAGVPDDLLAQDEEAISRNSGGAADQFKAGLQQIRQGDFQSAYRTFGEFETQNPNTAFSDNALFWSGIAAERMGQLDRAALALNDTYRKYPAEDRVPAALYYLAEVFLKTNSRDDAVLTLEKVRDDFPRNPYGLRAAGRLEELQPSKKPAPQRPAGRSRSGR